MDYYQAAPTQHEGQPKRVIGEYVRSHGFEVPEIFPTWKDAADSGKRLKLRSEHPQDYDGVSDLLFTYDSESNDLTLAHVRGIEDLIRLEANRQELISKQFGQKSPVSVYCDAKGISLDDFFREVSYSLWEAIPGTNHLVVSDSALPGRFHVMSSSGSDFFQYVIIDDGKITRQSSSGTDPVSSNLVALIETYGAIRVLERFDPHNCPIMEFQSDFDAIYFLQYHVGRTYSPANFALQGLKPNQPVFVRGATGPDGISCYAASDGDRIWDTEKEDSTLQRRLKVELEIIARSRTFVIQQSHGRTDPLIEIPAGHLGVSMFHKPQVSLISDLEPFLAGFDWRSKDSGRIRMRVISDGRNASIEPI